MCLSVVCWKSSYVLTIEKWRQKKSIKKSTVKVRKWTDDETTLFCEILVDRMNGFLQKLEYKGLKKALIQGVFA